MEPYKNLLDLTIGPFFKNTLEAVQNNYLWPVIFNITISFDL